MHHGVAHSWHDPHAAARYDGTRIRQSVVPDGTIERTTRPSMLPANSRPKEPNTTHMAEDIDEVEAPDELIEDCLLYTSPSPRDRQKSRMPSSA